VHRDLAMCLLIDAKSFPRIKQMTHVRHFYVDNLLRNLDTTLAVSKIRIYRLETLWIYEPLC